MDRRLACACPPEREEVHRAGEPLQVGRRQEEKAQAARRLRELQEPGSRGEAPLEAAESLHTP